MNTVLEIDTFIDERKEFFIDNVYSNVDAIASMLIGSKFFKGKTNCYGRIGNMVCITKYDFMKNGLKFDIQSEVGGTTRYKFKVRKRGLIRYKTLLDFTKSTVWNRGEIPPPRYEDVKHLNVQERRMLHKRIQEENKREKEESFRRSIFLRTFHDGDWTENFEGVLEWILEEHFRLSKENEQKVLQNKTKHKKQLEPISN